MSYYVFTIHKTHVAFRCEDGRTGSDPGTAAELLIERFKARFKIAEGEYEILDARVMQGDFVLVGDFKIRNDSPWANLLK